MPAEPAPPSMPARSAAVTPLRSLGVRLNTHGASRFSTKGKSAWCGRPGRAGLGAPAPGRNVAGKRKPDPMVWAHARFGANAPGSGDSSAPAAGRPVSGSTSSKKRPQTDAHLTRALPQVNPPPKTGRHTRSPSLMLPSRTASSKAMAQDAEEIFPYLLSVT